MQSATVQYVGAAACRIILSEFLRQLPGGLAWHSGKLVDDPLQIGFFTLA